MSTLGITIGGRHGLGVCGCPPHNGGVPWNKGLRGRPLSREHRAAIGNGRRGQTFGPLAAEHRAAIAAGLIGKPLSPEHRAKISAALRTPETRAKLAAYSRNPTIIGECAYCGKPATTRDHVIPRGRPGWDDPANVVLACRTCNDSKRDRTPDEWLADGLYGLRFRTPHEPASPVVESRR